MTVSHSVVNDTGTQSDWLAPQSACTCTTYGVPGIRPVSVCVVSVAVAVVQASVPISRYSTFQTLASSEDCQVRTALLGVTEAMATLPGCGHEVVLTLMLSITAPGWAPSVLSLRHTNTNLAVELSLVTAFGLGMVISTCVMPSVSMRMAGGVPCGV